MRETSEKIKEILTIIFIIAVIVVGYKIYKKNNFNEFTKAEHELGLSRFERDSSVKYLNTDSYKIINSDYNDAMFYETVNVTPNTPYRVSCKIKTKDVRTKEEDKDARSTYMYIRYC